MLPRRCKKCRCYVAPHLSACPRCGTKCPSIVVTKPTKEEQRAARAALDAKVPTIQGKHIHWIPSEFSVRAYQSKLKDLERMLARAETPRARNTFRSEIRAAKVLLARRTVPDGKKGWTTDHVKARHAYIVVFISPKKHRYVLAERDRPADLLIVPALKKNRLGVPVLRLERFEKSPHAKIIKKQEQEAKEHTVRRKVKKAHRAKKRLLKRTATS